VTKIIVLQHYKLSRATLNSPKESYKMMWL
jgi:hypothetical protein